MLSTLKNTEEFIHMEVISSTHAFVSVSDSGPPQYDSLRETQLHNCIKFLKVIKYIYLLSMTEVLRDYLAQHNKYHKQFQLSQFFFPI